MPKTPGGWHRNRAARPHSEFELANSRPREQTKLIMSLIERTIQISFRQRVHFTRHVFAPDNPLLADVLLNERSRQTPKILIVVDESLHVAQPDLAAKIETYFSSRAGSLQLVCPPIVLEGGERVKNSYFHVSEIQSY